MAAPQFIEEKPLSLAEVKEILDKAEKRDSELNYNSGRSKDFLENFVQLTNDKKEELRKKLLSLDLTRLKEEHISKIADFLPVNENELKIILQAYPLSLPKKDQDAIISVVKELAQ